MPYTTTHVLIAIILIELFREYFIKDNKKFPRYYILIAAIAAILPDIEYLFQLPNLQRAFLHSIFIPLIFLLIGFLTLKLNIKHSKLRKRHLNLSTIFFIFSAMTFLHIILDAVLRDGITPFYPFSTFLISLNLISYIPISENLTLVALDTILLFFWIFWMQFKLKIGDYF